MKSFVYAAASAAAFSAAILTSAYAQDSIDDEMLAMVGEFELTAERPTHTIVHAKNDKHYRICAGKESKSVKASTELKVDHDGTMTMVTPGNCSDFEAKVIKVSPAAPLKGDVVLIGKYRHVGERPFWSHWMHDGEPAAKK